VINFIRDSDDGETKDKNVSVLIPTNELYDEYVKLTDGHKYRISQKSYGRQLQQMLSLKPHQKRDGIERRRGYYMSINDLKEIIATKILKDPGYDFEPSLIKIDNYQKGSKI
jgi:hypothetical protein